MQRCEQSGVLCEKNLSGLDIRAVEVECSECAIQKKGLARSNGKEYKMSYTKHTHVYKKCNQYTLELDVYLTNNTSRESIPVVVYIHGGALIWGTREKVNETEVNAILSEGMAYVSIDYRLAPETSLMEIKKDVEDAMQWVREDGATLYGFDANRVAALGRSAGGYLALLSGTFLIPPQCIVSFYGYGDILGSWYAQPSPHHMKNPLVSPAEAAACVRADVPIHAGHERLPLYLRSRQTGSWASLVSGYDSSEVNAMLAPFCPIHQIGTRYPATFLLHGSVDTDVPAEQSQNMYAALADAGIASQLYIQPDADHGFDGSWENVPEEFGRVIEFLNRTL